VHSGRGGGTKPILPLYELGGGYLYAANETRESQVSAFAVNSQGGGLALLNRVPTRGDNSCYVSLSPSGRWLMVSNYSSGSLTVLPVREDGSLGLLTDLVQHSGSGPHLARQEQAHAHSIRFDPSGQYALAADLGMDRVLVYSLDEALGKLRLHDGISGTAEPGAGPRHMEWHPGGKILYVANELNSSVAVFAWDAVHGRLEPLQTVSTFPANAVDLENTVADIHLTPDGRFLYVSNRGHNSLAAFNVDAASGGLMRVGVYPSGGDWPRNFAIHPDGKYLLAANQYSGNVVVFQIHPDGSLSPTGEEIHVPSPVCVLFAPL
jgi:6-phosphogluconolactonase